MATLNADTLAFLYVAAGIGVSFNAIEETNKLMQDFESKNNSNGSPNKPPNFSKTGLILALTGLVAKEGDDQFAQQYREYRDNLVDYLKDFVGLTEGENQVDLGNYIYVSSSDKIYEPGSYYINAGKRSGINYYLPFKFDIQGENAVITFIDSSLFHPFRFS